MARATSYSGRPGIPMSNDTTPASIMRPLVDDLRERRAGRGSAARRSGSTASSRRQAHRARADRPARRRRDVHPEINIRAGIHHSVRGMVDKQAPADGVVMPFVWLLGVVPV
ncbi:MAG: hypothetical protein AVDCRST_MAG67-995 [uncultured Solirubrobacteraceae bacterium]|uniref:Uncharacterized protein n=1 Tax=uncultured Solirubrobacteraceae bacterium TaxID=1162706 RepID=A0A6J4S3E8_9ACTN|nr:MAG: hypothetical protein AVDCRST_MAG67-995 [uncultured Solirubrobacteraceae bacterium]